MLTTKLIKFDQVEVKMKIKSVGDKIEVTCPETAKVFQMIVTGRNWAFDKFVSYMVGYSAYGRTITTVNPSGVSQFSCKNI